MLIQPTTGVLKEGDIVAIDGMKNETKLALGVRWHGYCMANIKFLLYKMTDRDSLADLSRSCLARTEVCGKEAKMGNLGIDKPLLCVVRLEALPTTQIRSGYLQINHRIHIASL